MRVSFSLNKMKGLLVNIASWASGSPSVTSLISWARVWTLCRASICPNMHPLTKLLPKLANLDSENIHFLVLRCWPWWNKMASTNMIRMNKWSPYTRGVGSRLVPPRLHDCKIFSTHGPHELMSSLWATILLLSEFSILQSLKIASKDSRWPIP